MDYRVTVGLGQDSVDEVHLVANAAAVLEQLRLGEAGGDATANVDAVKATVEVVVVIAAADALDATRRALDAVQQCLRDANIPAPTSIVSVESESVPQPVRNEDVRPHAVGG